MQEACIGVFHANPILDLSHLPVRSLDVFAIALMATESCYVFMELLNVEDGRSTEPGIEETTRLVIVPKASSHVYSTAWRFETQSKHPSLFRLDHSVKLMSSILTI